MRIWFVILFICNAFVVMAQREALIKNEFKAGMTYTSTMNIVTDTEINLAGDEKTMNELKEVGLQYPSQSTGKMEIVAVVVAGEKSSRGVPLTILYPKFGGVQNTMGRAQPIDNPFENALIEGWGDAEGRIHIDTITGVDEEMQERLMQVMSSVQNNISFPSVPMRRGETFSQDVPFTVPVRGATIMEISLKNTYTLREIKNKKAFFDIVVSVAMNMPLTEGSEKGTMEAKGGGTGHATFDLAINCMTSYDSDVTMDLKMDFMGMLMPAKSKTVTSQITKVK